MTEEQNNDFSRRIEAVVRQVPGVAGIFHAGGFVSGIVDAGARVLGIRDSEEAVIRVDRDGERTRIDVAMSVYSSVGALDTTRRVEAAIRDFFAGNSHGIADVRITVVRVVDTPREEWLA